MRPPLTIVTTVWATAPYERQIRHSGEPFHALAETSHGRTRPVAVDLVTAAVGDATARALDVWPIVSVDCHDETVGYGLFAGNDRSLAVSTDDPAA
jgi:hypothetical protein